MNNLIKSSLLSISLLLPGASLVTAAEWSNTEVQVLYGEGFELGSNATGENSVTTVTLQHASGWKYGDNYFYFDMTAEGNGNKNSDIFGEYSPRLSIGKMTGSDLSFGIVKDVLISGGIDYGTNFIVAKYGFGVDLDIPGFDWFSLNAHVYDPLKGTSGQRKTSFQITPAWSASFEVASAKFEFTGFVDFTGSTGGNSKFQILAQPQLRLDVGNFYNNPGTLYVGIEYQLYMNKFGVDGIDEQIPQLLAVYKF